MSDLTLVEQLPEKFFDQASASYLSTLECAFHDKRLSGTSPSVSSYEEKLKVWFGTEYALPVASGSAAILLALYACGVQRGDKVVVSALAPIPSLLPILQLGAEPLFVDVEVGSFRFDAEDLKKAIELKPKALLAVALWGYPVLTHELIDVLADNVIPLIEDSAHAHGSIELGKFSGTVGSIGCFSTHDNKLLSTGEGGFVLTNSAELHERMKTYSHLGYCRGDVMGFNFKLGAPQALLGQDRLTRLESQIAARKTVASALLAQLSLPAIVAPIEFEATSHPNFYNLGFFIKAERACAASLISYCHERGVPSNAIKYNIKPSYRYPLLSPYFRLCKNAEFMAYNITSIPCLPELTESQISAVSELFNKAVSQFL
ncbi:MULTISPECIES: DegT/DnrJ/EryC1/StrS family aminotransferase [Pseudomonas]|uniref:BtrR protein n=2 Tax=Pseudomonas TaxID=286 RepID=A0A0D0TMK6_PSEFL|nr:MULTISPECIES: DegT/DnrJ/EryC1/StrS family aminotransferase [Pseudomonas fluorescens group]KIR22165.1 L-glutamine:2-deoxy-scyllo-inosose aminotransferase [Pseudomonas fluorescens]